MALIYGNMWLPRPTEGVPRFSGRTYRTPSMSEMFYGNRTPSGVLSTGFGLSRPKLLSMRRLTSRWLPPEGGRGLLRPNPWLNPTAARMGFGMMPMGTYGSYAARNLPFMRPTV